MIETSPNITCRMLCLNKELKGTRRSKLTSFAQGCRTKQYVQIKLLLSETI